MWYLLLSLIQLVSAEGEQKVRQLPTYTAKSFSVGAIIMIAFVLVPVGMMAYRNRTSIVELVKNR